MSNLPAYITRNQINEITGNNPRATRALELLIQQVNDSSFGDMYISNGAIAVAVALANTKYEISTGFTGGTLNLIAFDGAKSLKIQTAGTYLLNWSISANTNTALDVIEGVPMIGGVAMTKGLSRAAIPANNLPVTISGSVISYMNSGDIFSLSVSNNTAARNVVINNANMDVSILMRA